MARWVASIAATIAVSSFPGRAEGPALRTPQGQERATISGAQQPSKEGAAFSRAGQPSGQPEVPAVTTIDVTVVDAKGLPIAGLTAGAFRVSVDEKPWKVQSVEFVDLGTASGPPRAAGAPSGRALYLVVDQSSVFAGAERSLIDVASALVDRLVPGDRVALATYPEPGPRVALTEDPAAVQEALARVGGVRSPELANFGMGVGEAFGILENDSFILTSVADRECRFSRERIVTLGDQAARPGTADPRADCIRKLTKDVEAMTTQARRSAAPVLRGLLDLLTSLRDVAGPKAVVVVSSGLAVDRGPGAFDEVGLRAAAASASVHALVVEALQPGGGPRLRPVNPINDRRSLDSRLDDLSAAARGTSQVVNARSDETLDRLMQELTGFYRLTIPAAPGDGVQAGGPPRAQRLKVEVPGTGAIVRARPFLGRSGPPATRREATADERLADALRGGATPARDLSVRAAAYVFLGSNGAPSLVVAGDVQTGLEEAGADGTSMRWVLFDERRQPVFTGAFPSTTARTRPGRRAYVGALDGLTPGRYLLRVAAADGKGRTGSAEQPVDLRIAQLGDVTAGDLVLARLDPRAADAVPAAGTFDAGETIGLQVDLAGSEASAGGLGARFLVAAEGASTPLVTLEGVVDPPTGPVRRATAVVRTGLLPPGRYEARVEVTRGGRALGEVRRVFDVSPPAERASPSGAGGAGSGASAAAAREALWTQVPRFSRESVLAPAVLGDVLGALDRRTRDSRAREAIAHARTQPLDTIAVDAALRSSDPLTAAFLDGVALFHHGQLETAANQFREALRVNADFYPAMVYLGACYAAGGRDREAVGAWQTALVDQSDQVAVYRALVAALLRLRETATAVEFLDEAQGKWPDDATLVEQRVMTTLLQGRHAEALGVLDSAKDASADVLFMAMSLLYESNAAGTPIVSREDDRRRMIAYADRYRTAGGPQQALVERWLEAVK